MKILVVDRTSEGQAALAKLFESFDSYDLDSLDITVNLASEREYAEKLPKSDVLILGPGLEDDAQVMARQSRNSAPELQIIMIVNNATYSSGVFRVAHESGARKVLPDSASALDILQELVSIHEEYRASGRVKNGKLIVITQAKGGVGATSICAALGEICGLEGRTTLLWDFDVETMDLCRGLTANGPQAQVVNSWFLDDRDITRNDFHSALVSVSDSVSVLMPPDALAAAYALGAHDGVPVVQRIIDLARFSHDNIIVDLSGRMCPASEVLLRAADSVVVVVDDSILGLTAAHSYVSTLNAVLRSTDRIQFVCSGTKLSISQLAAQIGAGHNLREQAFRLPAIPFDQTAARWPGRGKTMYSDGRRATQDALVVLAISLGLTKAEQPVLRITPPSGKSKAVGLRERESLGQKDVFRHFMQKVASFSF